MTPAEEKPRDARPLPPAFLQRLAALEAAYLLETCPMRQSGFSGGAERWHEERSPILDALGSGELLDVGCANGYLLECLLRWGAPRGIHLTPHGLDLSPGLIALARQRLPRYATHFHIGNAWDWEPSQRYSQVYSVWDCVPGGYFGAYVRRLLQRVLAPGGLLIIGSYGNLSRSASAAPIDAHLASLGLRVLGASAAGPGGIARYAWVRAP